MDLTSWRWVLQDASDHTPADREVRLDRGSAHFEAFTDLLTYISWHATPDHADPSGDEYAKTETRDDHGTPVVPADEEVRRMPPCTIVPAAPVQPERLRRDRPHPSENRSPAACAAAETPVTAHPVVTGTRNGPTALTKKRNGPSLLTKTELNCHRTASCDRTAIFSDFDVCEF